MGRNFAAAMDLHLTGKTALVTGGSAGIGLACARELVAEGVDVALVARDAVRLGQAARSLAGSGRRVVPIAADLATAGGVAKAAAEAFAALGWIDILINNAGSAMGGHFLDLGDESFLGAWNLKLLGYIRMTRAIVPGMIERRDGRIVNVIGGAARTPTAGFLPGSTANAALVNFTRGLSKELAQHNVRINAISPGTTATERQDKLLEQRKKPGQSIEAARAEAASAVPLGRMVRPEEIAAAAAFLVSDRSAATTGTELQIDGGATPGI
jgi:3-oxoacyl-[acyl-carrier protein] reductase/bacilysin biosynthesis oxidoreductase BacG